MHFAFTHVVLFCITHFVICIRQARSIEQSLPSRVEIFRHWVMVQLTRAVAWATKCLHYGKQGHSREMCHHVCISLMRGGHCAVHMLTCMGLSKFFMASSG